jgi:hypothetical protein
VDGNTPPTAIVSYIVDLGTALAGGTLAPHWPSAMALVAHTATVLNTLNASAASFSLETIRSEQLEKYATRTLSTRIVGNKGSLTSLREWIAPDAKPAKCKPVKIAPIRDLFAASLFIRSQSLAKGEKVRTLVFPGGSPFLVDIESLGPEKITIANSPRDALRLDIKIQSVNTKKSNALEPHRKFRSGTLWLSNDPDRILLRAEVQVFVGYVFAELSSFQPVDSPPDFP